MPILDGLSDRGGGGVLENGLMSFIDSPLE